MIVYESNKNWLKDVRHLSRSWTMQRVVRSTLGVAGVTAVITFFCLEYFGADKIVLNISVFSLLGVVLSILLSFRTNTAYDRWWEGRKAWGDLVNNCRNLAVFIQSTWPQDDKKSRLFFAVQISNFCLSLKEHLRKGTKIEELIELTENDKKILSEKNHIPNFIALSIIKEIQQGLKDEKISFSDHLNIKDHSQQLINVLGICERIKKTPIPFSYNVYIKLFITLYTMCLPFALAPSFGYWTILMVAFVFFAFIGLELMAEEIEDPFGIDCNDLPTGDIALTIKSNVFEILEASTIKKDVPKEIYSKVF